MATPLVSTHTDTACRWPMRQVNEDFAPSPWNLLAAALDQLDCGLVVLDERLALLHANRHGRQRLLMPAGDLSVRLLPELMQRASQALLLGRRSLHALAGSPQDAVAVLPLPGQEGGSAGVLLVASRGGICSAVTLGLYAQQHRLTLAETQVLQALAGGASPDQIARQHGVAPCTTRTHISSIRQKTGSASITALLRHVAGLPPVGALVG
ncbi:helix-turn-helix transcriptional regulator [Aquincola tertiaricarbonis]|uniref:Helix-turn-helix transcriptional regulator n=1 Tax=Aquincola tertiaricarbonis TaxID=391953 RepID=A0ABY4RZ52_AQUTE|nr:helix-turn-helix transcriptional regulator [Aquincola tertiaricarbonis]URI05752.1 helix-turn-helix transcriptional regulator [Aquincola tertiaricarbonis]